MWKVIRFTIIVLFSVLCDCSFGQGSAPSPDTIKWPSPEVEQVYVHAKNYLLLGNYKDAMIAFKKAVILAPDIWQAQLGLGTAQYRAGEFKNAAETISALVLKHTADADCFNLLAMCFDAQKQNKNAKKAINEGLLRFPGSGLLYNKLGSLYIRENIRQNAVAAWMNGIIKDPEYCPNYRDASSLYLSSDNALWGLLLSEMYLNLSTDTTGFAYIKQSLFNGYKALYDNFAVLDKNGRNKQSQTAPGKRFEDRVTSMLEQLYPVVSDGISTENLTMLRTRLLMDLLDRNDSTLSFSLFNYFGLLIKTGHFDIYNEWLFGAAESTLEFAAWNNFHQGDMQRFIGWKEANKFKTVVTDIQLLSTAKEVEFRKKRKRS